MKGPCSLPLLKSALAGSLAAVDEGALHRHLEECEACGAALERMAGGTAWCEEAASLLAGDELDAALPARDEWSEVDFTVEHLEPADEPNLLGRLGGYDVLEILGHGGMGVVLKAYDRELKRCVAIKVLAPHLAQSSLAKQRFAREAQAAAAVVHPHVLAIHQVQPGGRLPFLVMPLVAGESLAERLKTHGTFELREILRIGMQAAAGLAAAHEQGLVHRDVKPANILLEKGVERAVLTDFGLARAGDDVSLTRWGVIAGTPEYMSPEQARGEPLDGRSDLFSLGCVLYEMATGVSPFRADSVIATLRRLVEEPPREMAALNPELPTWFISIVDRLLEKNPSRRFGSAQEVSELLEGCLAHVQQPANVPLPAQLIKRPRLSLRSIFMFTVGVLTMISASLIAFFGALLQLADPPDIAGEWSGDDWGKVVLKRTGEGEYAGTYTDTYRDEPGEIQLKWSRVERRYYGKWSEGEGRFGDLSVRLVESEIRGAWTADAKSKINPGTPHLADLAWRRPGSSTKTSGSEPGALSYRVPFEVGAILLRDRDRITIDDVRGTADTMKPGNTYEIRGTYRLASQDKATLAVYNTADGKVDKAKPATTDPTLKTQWMQVERGEGKFALVFYLWHDGKPHISFYSEAAEPKGMGHVYFGTGESVLKKGWWETPAAALPVKVDAKSTKGVQHFPTRESVEIIACSADGKLIAIANGNVIFPIRDDSKREVEILDAESGKTIVSLQLHTKDEHALLSATEGLPGYEIGPLAFSPDGKLLAVATGVGQVKLFNARTGELVRSFDDDKAKLAEKRTPEKLKSLPRAMGSVNALTFSSDGRLLAMCGESFGDVGRSWGNIERGGLKTTGPGRLKIWEVESGKLKHDLAGHSDARTISFSADGSLLASAGSWAGGTDGGHGVIVWDSRSGEKLRTIPSDTNGFTHAVVFSPASKLLAIGSLHFDKENDTRSTTIRLIYALTGIMEWQRTVPGAATPKAFSGDGKIVAAHCGRESIQLFETGTGKTRLELKAADTPERGRWNDLGIAPQGKLLAIGGADAKEGGFVRLLSLEESSAEVK